MPLAKRVVGVESVAAKIYLRLNQYPMIVYFWYCHEDKNVKTKVTTRGQVSIPAEIRKKLHIETDTKLEWSIDGNAIRVIPVPKDPISAFRGRGKGVYTTQDLLKERRQDRNLEDERDQSD